MNIDQKIADLHNSIIDPEPEYDYESEMKDLRLAVSSWKREAEMNEMAVYEFAGWLAEHCEDLPCSRLRELSNSEICDIVDRFFRERPK